MIHIQNASKLFHARKAEFRALNNINLVIERGEVFGIIGRSGAGKSTLLRLINLLERPSAGNVYIENQNINELNIGQRRRLRQRMGFIFQHFNLLNSKTVARYQGAVITVF
jgi:D-methionine transport system ATP-binding protein